MVKAAVNFWMQFDLKMRLSPATFLAVRRAVIIALLTMGAAEAADLAAADARTLEAALARAEAGDRILLAPGDYGDLAIGPRRGKGSLTILAADPAAPPVFRSIFVRDAEDLTLAGLTVIYGAAADPLAERAVEVRRSSSIRLSGLRVASAANDRAGDDASGVILRDSRDVRIERSHIHDVFRGVVIYDSDAVTVSGATFSRIGSDGVAARGVADLTIENNSFSDFTPADPVKWHPDAVQLWSRGAVRANQRIIIRGNVVRRGEGGATQGIFVKSPEIASRDILIEGNRIEQSMGQGIFVQNAAGVTIRNNTLVAVEPVLHPPAIEVRAPFENAVVEHNDAPKFRLPVGVEAHSNKIVQQADQN